MDMASMALFIPFICFLDNSVGSEILEDASLLGKYTTYLSGFLLYYYFF